jgi:DNA mismatch endonuclease (patch repair protein)
MKLKRSTPSFTGLHPASASARRAAKGASKKMGTKCELALRRALWAMGIRYRKCVPGLAGRPDLILPRYRVVIFCDGDFWHGRDLDSRLARLARGHNASYWTEKIRTNVQRDHAVSERLTREGWLVIRLWETDILRDPKGAAAVVAGSVPGRGGNSVQGGGP